MDERFYLLKEKIKSHKNTLLIILFSFLTVGLLSAVKLAGQKQEIRKKASTPKVTFSIYPADESFKMGEVKTFEIKAVFSDVPASTRLDYLKTEIAFNKDILEIPKGQYVDTSLSGFGKVIRVDGPIVANQNGKIIIELGAVTPDSGPVVDKPLTVAKIYLGAKNINPDRLELKLGKTQVVSHETEIPYDDQNSKGASYTVIARSDAVIPTDVISVTPTPLPIIPTGSFPSPTVFIWPTQKALTKEVVFVSPTFKPRVFPSSTPIPTPTPKTIPTDIPVFRQETPAQIVLPTRSYRQPEQISPTVYQRIVASPTTLPFESLGYITPTPQPKSIMAVFDFFKSFFCGILKNC